MPPSKKAALALSAHEEPLKKVVLVLFCLSFSLLLAGCSGNSPSTSEAQNHQSYASSRQPTIQYFNGYYLEVP